MTTSLVNEHTMAVIDSLLLQDVPVSSSQEYVTTSYDLDPIYYSLPPKFDFLGTTTQRLLADQWSYDPFYDEPEGEHVSYSAPFTFCKHGLYLCLDCDCFDLTPNFYSYSVYGYDESSSEFSYDSETDDDSIIDFPLPPTEKELIDMGCTLYKNSCCLFQSVPLVIDSFDSWSTMEIWFQDTGTHVVYSDPVTFLPEWTFPSKVKTKPPLRRPVQQPDNVNYGYVFFVFVFVYLLYIRLGSFQ